MRKYHLGVVNDKTNNPSYYVHPSQFMMITAWNGMTALSTGKGAFYHHHSIYLRIRCLWAPDIISTDIRTSHHKSRSKIWSL